MADKRSPRICVKRAYGKPSSGDGRRFLVDGLWPRGVKKEALEIEAWVKEVAPSKKLRQWFGHDPEKWEAFRERYHEELDANEEAWRPLPEAARSGTITLVFGAKDAEHNNAVALRDYLMARMRRRKR
jgi:uncharacterized protein YeaO (DUF488 family)